MQMQKLDVIGIRPSIKVKSNYYSILNQAMLQF